MYKRFRLAIVFSLILFRFSSDISTLSSKLTPTSTRSFDVHFTQSILPPGYGMPTGGIVLSERDLLTKIVSP
jgi:hypothetical protein